MNAFIINPFYYRTQKSKFLSYFTLNQIIESKDSINQKKIEYQTHYCELYKIKSYLKMIFSKLDRQVKKFTPVDTF